MAFTDAQGDVAQVLNAIRPDIRFLVDSQGGDHPLSVFGIVGEVERHATGTMRKQLRSSTGKWMYAQPYDIMISVGVQGSESSSAAPIAHSLRFLFECSPIKSSLRALGYSVRLIDGDTKRIPMQRNTDMFVRHTFNITLSCDVLMSIDGKTIDGVDVVGTLYSQDGGTVLHEFNADIRSS